MSYLLEAASEDVPREEGGMGRTNHEMSLTKLRRTSVGFCSWQQKRNALLVERNTGLGIEGGGGGGAEEIGGDDLILGVAARTRTSALARARQGQKNALEDTLEVGLGSLLHGGLDLVVGSGLLNASSEVDDRDRKSVV